MGFYEDTATGLFEAVAIEKGEIEMEEKMGMPAKTLVAKNDIDNFEAARELGKVEGILKGQLDIIEMFIDQKIITIDQAAEAMNVSIPKMEKILKKRKETNQFEDGLEKAWDPDFTKATKEEKKRIDNAVQEMKNGKYFSEADVWSD